MNNHIGHLQRVLAFTVQVLKQDSGKTLSNKESIFMSKNWFELVEKYGGTTLLIGITLQLIYQVLFIKQIHLWKSFVRKPINTQRSFSSNRELGTCSPSCCQT